MKSQIVLLLFHLFVVFAEDAKKDEKKTSSRFFGLGGNTGLNGFGSGLGQGLGGFGQGLNGFGSGLGGFGQGLNGGLGQGNLGGFGNGFGSGGFGNGGFGGLGNGFGGVGGGLGGIGQAPPSDCRYWCRTTQGQAYCCENANQPQSFVGVKAGQCPPVRPVCPPTRSFSPPSTCSNDGSCSGLDKCCYDTCLQEHVCKAPYGFGR